MDSLLAGRRTSQSAVASWKSAIVILLTVAALPTFAAIPSYAQHSPSEKSATAPAFPAATIQETGYPTWIERLGDSDFHTRQAAEHFLQRAGEKAIVALNEAKQGCSYEQKLRIERLLAKIEQVDETKLLEQFIDGKTTLPGWSLFEELVSDSEANRHSFVELYRHQSHWLEQIESDQEDMDEFYRSYSRTVSQNPNQQENYFAIHSLMAAGFAREKKTDDSRRNKSLVCSIYLNFGKNILPNGGKFKQLNESAINLWLSTDNENNSIYQQQLRIAIELDQPSGIHVARIVIDSNQTKSIPHSIISEALEVLFRYGDQSDLHRLSLHLDDSQRVFTGSFRNKEKKLQTYHSLIRDTALAATLRIHGIDPATYGLISSSDRPLGNQSDARHRFGFPTRKMRKSAFGKWELEKANLNQQTNQTTSFNLPDHKEQTGKTSPKDKD